MAQAPSICLSMQKTQETQVGFLGQEDLLEEGMATCSRILAWKSHGERSLAGYSPWGHKRVGHDRATKEQQILDPVASCTGP